MLSTLINSIRFTWGLFFTDIIHEKKKSYVELHQEKGHEVKPDIERTEYRSRILKDVWDDDAAFPKVKYQTQCLFHMCFL